MKNDNLKTWNSYLIPNLQVVAALMGSSQWFLYESYEIQIKLPEPTNESDCKAYSWILVNDVEIPLEYSIDKVQVMVTLKEEKIDIPEQAFRGNNIDHSCFTREQQTQMDCTLKKYSDISQRAFLYWLDMLRWESGNSSIGKEQAFSNQSGWSTYLVSGNIEKRIYSSVDTITIMLTEPLGIALWMILQKKVSSNIEFPMYMKFMFDAKESMRLNYPERAIVELALSCENYLRYSVFKLLPENLRDDFVEYIEEANINQFLNRFFKNSFDESYLKATNFTKLKKEISSLLNKRNKYMHMGNMEDATQKRFSRYLKALNELFLLKIEYKIHNN